MALATDLYRSFSPVIKEFSFFSLVLMTAEVENLFSIIWSPSDCCSSMTLASVKNTRWPEAEGSRLSQGIP